MKNYSINTDNGFTLIEMVVAVVIFGFLSVMAYGGLNRVLAGQEHLQESSKRLKDLQIAFRYIERDMNHAINRPIRDQFGDLQDSFIGDEDKTLSFTHSGWRNPANLTRSHIQRVAYELSENTLTRYTWAHLDGAIAEDYIAADLVSDIDSIKIRYLDQGNQWHTQWPPVNSTQPFPAPRAIEMMVVSMHMGEIRRVFTSPCGGGAQC